MYSLRTSAMFEDCTTTVSVITSSAICMHPSTALPSLQQHIPCLSASSSDCPADLASVCCVGFRLLRDTVLVSASPSFYFLLVRSSTHREAHSARVRRADGEGNALGTQPEPSHDRGNRRYHPAAAREPPREGEAIQPALPRGEKQCGG